MGIMDNSVLYLLDNDNILNEVKMFNNTIGFDNICIVGTGAIGSSFGGFLSNAGYKVTFVEKNEDIIKQVEENGLSISGVKDCQ
jgi:pyruvate/2-oxoglutarate dehydrogenase complex dihydrolipoamide dehydrogenase (E3) component